MPLSFCALYGTGKATVRTVLGQWLLLAGAVSLIGCLLLEKLADKLEKLLLNLYCCRYGDSFNDWLW